ncbi:spermatogenesis-associated protein 48 isoform X2 [Rhinatrema bivittatum]|uniref:spermatogenesis-associated protein 48 isoform X2 n=1 Tax=Rhinatrema bivittatum TaxID=194408 RepID=UPI00112608D2|nr:spermatogenesis-associated protein 48 isoform X2 [Rhinatrema bivittatum]
MNARSPSATSAASRKLTMPERRRLSMAEPPGQQQQHQHLPQQQQQQVPAPRFHLQPLGPGAPGGSRPPWGRYVREPFTSLDAELQPGRPFPVPGVAASGGMRPRQLGPVGWAPERPTQLLLLPGGREEPTLQPPPQSPMIPPGGREEPTPLLHPGAHHWNSKAISDAARRAQLGGWTSQVKVIPTVVTRGPKCNLTQTFAFKVDPTLQHLDDAVSAHWRDEIARKHMYTTSSQRTYEDISWDTKLPPKISPPETTLEKMADPVSRHFTWKRYKMEPAVWQAVGGIWDRFQTRPFHSGGRPITFVSPSPRICQIPLYSGCIGGENLEDMDNSSANFIPFTILRTPQPRPTTHNGNIPGYTGRIQWTLSHPPTSYMPSSAPINSSTSARVLSK